MQSALPSNYQTALRGNSPFSQTHKASRRKPGNLDLIARHHESSEKNPPISSKLMMLVLLFASTALIFSLSLYAFAVFYGEDISRAGHSISTKPVEIVIGNSALSVPENVIRFSNQRKPGSYERLELYLHWPMMRGYSDKNAAIFNRTGKSSSLLFVSLEPRVMSLDMSGRIGPIYSKFFEGPATSSTAGLIAQPLSADGGFINETLFYEAESPYPYATRCERARAKVGTPFCMRDIHIGKDLMLTYRYHIDFLPHWRQIERSVRNYISGLILNK